MAAMKGLQTRSGSEDSEGTLRLWPETLASEDFRGDVRERLTVCEVEDFEEVLRLWLAPRGCQSTTNAILERNSPERGHGGPG